MIKAIVFDCDGLLIDTETAYYKAFRDVFQQYGVDLPLDVYLNCVGTSFDHFNPYDYLQERVGRSLDIEAVEQEVVRKRDELNAQQSLMPGVEAYLREAKRTGLKIGLASSSSSGWIEEHVGRCGALHYFDTIQTKDKVSEVKPNPELYLRALHELGVSGEQAIAFEDSAHGLNAAKAAGMHCVIIPNSITSHLTFADYDLRLRSMADMPLTEVIEAIQRRTA